MKLRLLALCAALGCAGEAADSYVCKFNGVYQINSRPTFVYPGFTCQQQVGPLLAVSNQVDDCQSNVFASPGISGAYVFCEPGDPVERCDGFGTILVDLQAACTVDITIVRIR